MALSEAWGWGGWVVVVLLPLSFWALLAFLVVLVFHRGPTEKVEVVARLEKPVAEPVLQGSALGWLPPVVPHH
jgi:hypothetical protein